MNLAADPYERTEVRDGMRITWHQRITTDDGLVLRADVYRPLGDAPCPVILTYGIYGKGLAYQDGYPLQWNKMVEDYPEIANIFDNLHMMHDSISDILSSELFPTWEDKRKEIYRVTQNYYWASADATNPYIVPDGQPQHEGSTTEKSKHSEH